MDESFIGKIIKINLDSKETKILSKGHRNPQGLFYDKKNNVIYSTDHGPMGGDEININTNPENKIPNYGWAEVSYGEHYGYGKFNPDEELYQKAPLKKPHQKYGFKEPIKYFKDSIGITQILKLSKKMIDDNFLHFFVGAMGTIEDKDDMSIHYIVFDNKFNEKKHKIIRLDDRVRDLTYDKQNNIVIGYLENNASIILISYENN